MNNVYAPQFDAQNPQFHQGRSPSPFRGGENPGLSKPAMYYSPTKRDYPVEFDPRQSNKKSCLHIH